MTPLASALLLLFLASATGQPLPGNQNSPGAHIREVEVKMGTVGTDDDVSLQ